MSSWQIFFIVYFGLVVCAIPFFLREILNDKENETYKPWTLFVFFVLFVPFLYLILIVECCRRLCKYGWRLGWVSIRHVDLFDRWESIKEAKAKRIDKELNGWPEDPIERAECPRLKMHRDNEFECNDYIHGAERTLIYVANETCPELEDLFENHLDELNRWAAPMRTNIVYLPTLFKALQDDEIKSYKMPWASDIPNNEMTVGNDYMFRFLIHPEDRERMKHGLYLCQSIVRSDHYVNTYISSYYELLSPSEKDWGVQLEELKQKLYNEAFWLMPGPNCTVKNTAGDEPEDFADNQFNTQQPWSENVDDLMIEIRERVEKLRQRGVGEHLLLELIRPKKKLSQMLITKDYRLFLTDYNNLEIKMEPLVKAVYLLFLNHPEGILFKHLPDYREELTQIYVKLRPNGMSDRVKQSIEDVTNPLLNSINEKCARIRGAFVGQFDDWLAKHYYIDGMRGEPKKISLDHDLIVWE